MNGVHRKLDDASQLDIFETAKELINLVNSIPQPLPPASLLNESCVAAANSHHGIPKIEVEDEESLSGQDNNTNDSSGSSSSVDDATTSTPPPAKKRKTLESGNKAHDRRLIAFSRSLHRRKPSRDQVSTTPTGGAVPLRPTSDEKEGNARRHENGVAQLLLQQELAVTRGHPESRMTASSPSPSLEQPNNRVDHVNIDNSNTMMAMMANTSCVYFGWIRHPATKAWRDTVKIFSQNHREFPSWSDDICAKMRNILREEKNIEHFYICRRGPNENSTGSGSAEKQKKIFDKQKNYTGTWYPATEQEILDRTKQRFVDDRKPQAMVTGAKRPRGRPPKTVSREASLELLPLSNPKSATETYMTLHPLLVKWNHELQRLDKKKEQVNEGSAPESGDKSVMQPDAPKVAEMTIEPSKLVEVMADLDRMQMHVRKELETALSRSAAAADSAVSSLAAVGVKTGSPSENPPKQEKLNQENLSVPSRTPWFPVMSKNVCFDWNQHEGTVKWREVVKTFSDNLQQFPEWTDRIADLVKDELARMECEVFLLFLDSQGNRSESIHDGLWYRATDDDIVTRTKQEFLRCRAQTAPTTTSSA